MEHVQNIPSSIVNISGLHSSSTTSIINNESGALAKAKHKQFKLTVYGLNGGDEEERDAGVQVKVTQETTVQQVIEQVTTIF